MPTRVRARFSRNQILLGRHITDCQMRIYMKFRKTDTPTQASRRARPSQKQATRVRRSLDPLAALWDRCSEIVPMPPGCAAVAHGLAVAECRDEPVYDARWSDAQLFWGPFPPGAHFGTTRAVRLYRHGRSRCHDRGPLSIGSTISAWPTPAGNLGISASAARALRRSQRACRTRCGD